MITLDSIQFCVCRGGGYEKVIYITYIHLIINNDTEDSQQCAPITPPYSHARISASFVCTFGFLFVFPFLIRCGSSIVYRSGSLH